ncbi:ribonuclease T2-like protein [Arthroderma uncinatum]|uniref:ribonuclease T2-like protein n=1 Tax=Arthroderma uncinatum TaxID=74035 RepID=UPI00144AE9CC|nr:ribonuclease T2-like protein [Arthroderma uncinatum]KAF3482878.1 ribonuclease T2-like protein [Arthroderma uncinatum]
MLSSTSVVAGALLAASQLSGVYADGFSCPPGGEVSCHNSGPVQDTCCFNSPGGLIALTQFWDADPATGPEDSWTIHGLWPDNCDGTYEQFCDMGREYTNITDILKAQNRNDVLDYMNMYFKDYKGNDESFWEHEWNKHGTCMSTFEPSCYMDYMPQEEVGDYFAKIVELFKGLNTYKALADAGITPSNDKTYDLSAMEAAIKASFGMEITLNCRNGALNEAWYFYNVRGSAQTGEYIPTLPGGTPSTCPKTGIKYVPKSGGSTPPPTTSSPSGPAPTGIFAGKGYLVVTTRDSQDGCLISSGNWYTTGTCATYTAAASGSGFTLTSSKGVCGMYNGQFKCGSGVAATVFGSSSGKLSASGKDTFYADKVPSGTTQVPIYTSPHSVPLTVSWQAV